MSQGYFFLHKPPTKMNELLPKSKYIKSIFVDCKSTHNIHLNETSFYFMSVFYINSKY